MLDYFECPQYKIWLGDCLDKMSQIEDGSIDMILADLPYGTTASKWDIIIPFEPLWKHYKRVIKRNGAVVLFGSEPFSSLLRVSNLGWYKYDWVWIKNKKTGHLNAQIMPLMGCEDVLVFGYSTITYNSQKRPYNPNSHSFNYKMNKEQKIYGNVRLGQIYYKSVDTKKDLAFPDNILYFDVVTRRLHPTQKPVPLLSYLIRTYTHEGETILDNTMGSGSTGEACLRTGRKFMGIELDENYYSITCQRLEEVYDEVKRGFDIKKVMGRITSSKDEEQDILF